MLPLHQLSCLLGGDLLFFIILYYIVSAWSSYRTLKISIHITLLPPGDCQADVPVTYSIGKEKLSFFFFFLN